MSTPWCVRYASLCATMESRSHQTTLASESSARWTSTSVDECLPCRINLPCTLAKFHLNSAPRHATAPSFEVDNKKYQGNLAFSVGTKSERAQFVGGGWVHKDPGHPIDAVCGRGARSEAPQAYLAQTCIRVCVVVLMRLSAGHSLSTTYLWKPPYPPRSASLACMRKCTTRPAFTTASICAMASKGFSAWSIALMQYTRSKKSSL